MTANREPLNVTDITVSVLSQLLAMAANDFRGWVMSAVSGVGEYDRSGECATGLTLCFTACILGSAVICVDLVLRKFSHHKTFQIANSNNFLSASLCLSAGVMVSPFLTLSALSIGSNHW